MQFRSFHGTLSELRLDSVWTTKTNETVGAKSLYAPFFLLFPFSAQIPRWLGRGEMDVDGEVRIFLSVKE